MILNKLLDKAVEVAKQSALQIYGYNYSELKDNFYENGTAGRHGEGRRQTIVQPEEQQQPASSKELSKGVTFERSGPSQAKEHPEAMSSKLAAIREYAAKQAASDVKEINNWGKALPPDDSPKKEGTESSEPSKQVYSRKDIRKKQNNAGNREALPPSQPETPSTVSSIRRPAVNVKSTGTHSGNQDPSRLTEGTDQKNLQKRLDRLESLMHLSLSSEDLSYASHPAFHKLLHKGVPKRLITGWFHNISDQGINPEEQQQLFQSKLSFIIQEAITEAQADTPRKMQLFAGRSGSGKTHLIMKLSNRLRHMENKHVAIASVDVDVPDSHKRYTILDPYCKDQGLPYYCVNEESDLDSLMEEWEMFDHILVDTPSMEVADSSLDSLINITQMMQLMFDNEIHYIINTAVNGMAFNDPLAAQIEADHIALTQIDKSNRWGKAVQLIAQTDYCLRYISDGESIPDSLTYFNPEHFAGNLLQ